MKKLFFATAIILGCLSFQAANAQVHFSVNIGVQPEWGPVGYDHAEYYYMPDIDTYYDVPHHQYVYFDNNHWVHAGALPPRYASFDRYHGYKVVINDDKPWRHADVYRGRYANYRGRHDQVVIRDSHDDHYRNHWHEDGGHDGHDGHGHDHDHGR